MGCAMRQHKHTIYFDTTEKPRDARRTSRAVKEFNARQSERMVERKLKRMLEEQAQRLRYLQGSRS